MPQNLADNIEKLLEIAETAPEEKSEQPKTSEVDRYIKKLSIKEGDTKIPKYVVYYHYYHWRTDSRRRLSRAKFYREMNKYFDTTRVKDSAAYSLDPEPFDTSIEGYFKARALLRRQRDGRRRKKAEKSKK